MQIEKDLKETLKWDIELNEAKATIHNGKLVSFTITPPMSAKDRTNVQIFTEQDARAILEALGELIQHLDKSRGFDRPGPELVEMKSPPLNAWPSKEEGSES